MIKTLEFLLFALEFYNISTIIYKKPIKIKPAFFTKIYALITFKKMWVVDVLQTLATKRFCMFGVLSRTSSSRGKYNHLKQAEATKQAPPGACLMLERGYWVCKLVFRRFSVD